MNQLCDPASVNGWQDTDRLDNSILKQKDSWDYLMVTLDIMRKILSNQHVSPVFLRYLHAFGSKTKGEDENFNGYHFMPLANGPAHRGIQTSYGLSTFFIRGAQA